MGVFDQHLHSWFSADSLSDPADNVRAAVDTGLAGLTFTDHFDSHPIEVPLCQYDYDALAAALADLRGEFGDKLFIGHGIEICYHADKLGRILAYLDGRRFDVVLLSVHWMQGRATHIAEHWTDWNIATATRVYLETVAEMVDRVGELARQGCRPFDVLAHLDMIKRYTQWFRQGFDIASHAELVDRILRGCLEAGLILEVNTSGLRQGVNEPMPAAWIVRRYADLGGEAVSLGSDAHRPEHVGQAFAQVAQMLKDNGIRHLAVFRDRQCNLEPL